MHVALIVLRLVHFAASMAVFGAAAFRFYGLPQREPHAGLATLGRFDRWLARMLTAGAALVLVSGLLMLPCVVAGMTGSARSAIDPATLAAVLRETSFGQVWCVHLLLAGLLASATAMPAARRVAAVLPLAGLVLASLAFVGHAADQSGWAGFGHETNQCVHLWAAGVWLGGLLPLGWLLRRAGDASGADAAALARQALPVFSRMGYGAVALIALTGVVNTAILAGKIGALIHTDYGRLLSLKMLLYLAMVALAAANRVLLVPRLLHRQHAAAPIMALYRSVLAEQAVGFCVLAAVAVLGTLPPPGELP